MSASKQSALALSVRLLIMTIASMLVSLNAIADVETSSISLLGGDLRVIQVPSPATDYTDIFFNYTPSLTTIPNRVTTSPATITFVNTDVDEGSDWYLANYGDEFTASTIASGSFKTFVNDGGNPNVPSTPIGNTLKIGCLFSNCAGNRYLSSGTFYLGVNTGTGFTNNYRTAFGWAEFSYDSTGIQLLSSAMTYDQARIIIGTSTTIAPVPEPSEYMLMLMGFGLTGFIAARRKKDA